jgi:hypothetical protein
MNSSGSFIQAGHAVFWGSARPQASFALVKLQVNPCILWPLTPTNSLLSYFEYFTLAAALLWQGSMLARVIAPWKERRHVDSSPVHRKVGVLSQQH